MRSVSNRVVKLPSVMTLSVPVLWADALALFMLALRASGAPATTIATRANHVRRIARTLGVADPWAVTGAQLVAWCGGQSWAVETRRGYRGTLLAFYRWGHGAGLIDANPADELPVVKPAAPRPRPAPEHAYREALAMAGPRERLMLRLAAEAGMRRAEVAHCHGRDLVEDLDGWSLIVHGKGGRVRTVPLSHSLAAELRRAGGRDETGRPIPGGWVFPGNDHGHLSPRWVGKLIAELLPGEHTMHALRHRFATRTYQVSSRDVFVVQELLGHASPATTRRYVHVPPDHLRAAVEAVARIS